MPNMQRTVNVPVVGATLLSTAMPDGATIVNSDPTNAVWISDDAGVAPGSGIELAPVGGSVQWSNGGGPVYACADTGVTAPVTLQVSESADNLANPVAVATAVATALLASGIPNVLVEETVPGTSPSIIFGLALGTPTGVVRFDVHKYASILLTNADPNNISNFYYRWLDAAGVPLPGSSDYEAVAFPAVVTAAGPGSSVALKAGFGLELRVVGYYLQLLPYNVGGIPVRPLDTITLGPIIGSNRPALAQQRRTGSGSSNLVNVARLAGQTLAAGNYPLTPDMTIAGPVFMEFSIGNSTVVKGVFRLYQQVGADANTIDLADTAEMHANPLGHQAVMKMVNLPRSSYQIVFICQTGGSTSGLAASAVTT